MSKEMSDNQYVYLVQEREFIKTKENIFKIGRTNQTINKRMIGYPKQSKLLLCLSCSDCVMLEKQIKKQFKKHYIQRKDIGHEYFEGDSSEMIQYIMKIHKQFEYLEKLTPCDDEEDTFDTYSVEVEEEEEEDTFSSNQTGEEVEEYAHETVDTRSYYEKNKEKLINYSSKYKQKNKDKVAKHNRTYYQKTKTDRKVECPNCQGSYDKYYLKRHQIKCKPQKEE